MVKATNKQQFTRENVVVANNENLMRETEPLLIAAQYDDIVTNHIKAEIDKTQQNSTSRLCGDWDKTIIISKFSKIAQKGYKTKNGWVGKMINGDLCKKLMF